MKTITCKKCGMEIDPSLGECPNCGAVYYILPEQQNSGEELKSFSAGQGATAPKGHESIDFENALNDDLFSTSVWKSSDEEEFTRIFKAAAPTQSSTPQTPRRPAAPQQVQNTAPVRRQPAAAAQRPVQRQPVASDASARRAQETAAAARDKKHKRMQMGVAGVALLALLVLVLSIMSGAFNFGDKSVKEKMVSVLGQPQETALAVLRDSLGLDVTVMQETSQEQAGIVIRQSIAAEKAIKKGDKVTLTVSSGPEEGQAAPVVKVKVPTLEGKSFDQASTELSNLGLLITTAADVYDEKVEAGKVVAQNIKAGTEVQKGDMITVTLSKGKEPYKITVTAGPGGSVSPNGVAEVEKGKDISFTITPEAGYEIREIKVDGAAVEVSSSYTFTAVTANHTIYVVFQKAQETTPPPTESHAPASPTGIQP